MKYWLFGLSSEHKKRKFQLNRKFIDITAPRSPSIKRGTKRFPFSFIFNKMTSHFFHVRLVRFSLFYVCYLLAAKTNKINKKIDKKIIGYDFNQLFLFLLSFSKSYGICLIQIHQNELTLDASLQNQKLLQMPIATAICFCFVSCHQISVVMISFR